jgi:hypothetical protein
MNAQLLAWVGIVLLILQSGAFSGLNLALFGVSAMRLTTLANTGDRKAAAVLALRRDSNFLLTTILWGNVGTNVLLTLLADSVMAGVAGFLFSTVVITFGGEILPQAYFSRNALRMAALGAPLLRFYQLLLYPIAKPSALLLDAWLGKESIDYVPEAQVIEGLRQHVGAPESDIGHVEGTGAINFLTLDDVPVSHQGQPVDPRSVLPLPVADGRPVFPSFSPSTDDPFLRAVHASGKKWVVITSPSGEPVVCLDAPRFLRLALFDGSTADPMTCCHRPIVVSDPAAHLAGLIEHLPMEAGTGTIANDLILLWGEHRRVITGADLLGFLLRGIAR